MIKDIIANLDVDSSRDVTADYAISAARAFGAHVSAVAFAYEAVVPGSIFGRESIRLLEAERARCETTAKMLPANSKRPRVEADCRGKPA